MNDAASAKHEVEDIPKTYFSDMVSELTPDKNCHKPGCYGRGYYGGKSNPDGSKEILFCSCAKFMDTGYVQLAKRLGEHRRISEESMRAILANQVALHGHVTKKFREAADARLWIRFKKLFSTEPLELRSANDISEHIRKGEPLPGPPQGQPVPVLGEVQSYDPLTKP